MKIGDRIYVHGYVDEIRKDCVIIHNDGGYFGTVKSEIVEAQKAEDIVSVTRCKDCKWYYRGGATCMYWDGENGMRGDDYCSQAERKDNGAD